MKVPNQVMGAIRSLVYAHTKEVRVYKRSDNDYLIEMAQGSALVRAVVSRDGSIMGSLTGGQSDFSGHTEGTLIAKLSPDQWQS